MRRRRVRARGARTFRIRPGAVLLAVALCLNGCGERPRPGNSPSADADVASGDSPTTPAPVPVPARPGADSAADPTSDAPTDATTDPTTGHATTDSVEPDSGPWFEARRRGVDFRAIGQEPGWFLEIDHDGSTLFAWDYGAERTTLPTPEPFVDAGARRTTYRATLDAGELVIVVEARDCFDTMSGEAFDHVVVVTLDAMEYRGCGRRL